MTTALIIEDNEDNMVLLCTLLESRDYGILKAMTGAEGIEKAVASGPDLVLLDIQLPDMDGFEVERAIREAMPGVHIPVIAVTSFAMSGDRERALASGFDAYFEKPIDPSSFLDDIEAILKRFPC